MEEELGKLTLTLTKRKTVKFLNLFTGTLFAGFSTSLNFCQKPAQRRVRSARSPRPKLERQKSRFETGAPRYSINDLFCLSLSPFFGKDTLL